jgi:hypothetical protein
VPIHYPGLVRTSPAQKWKSIIFVWSFDLAFEAVWALVCDTVDAQFLAYSSNSFIQEK